MSDQYPGYSGPINPNPSDGEAPISIFGYIPNKALGCVGAIIFALCFVGHFGLFLRLKPTRMFQGLMTFGCVMEVVGYCFRLLAHYKPFFRITWYNISSLLWYVLSALQHGMHRANGFTSGTCVFLSGFSIRCLPYGVGHGLLSFSPKLFVAVFIAADVVTTIIQIVGAASIGVSESSNVRGRSPASVTTKQANDILLSGLAIQCASFLAFLVILIVVTFRSNQTRPVTLRRKFTGILIFTSPLVFLRTVFRLAETASGVFSPAATNEILFGLLEFLPVGAAVALWAACSLDSMLPPDASEGEVEKWGGRSFSRDSLGRTGTVHSRQSR